MAKRKRRSFSPDFKAEAVRLCKLGDRNVTQVAKDLDLTETALRAWVKAAETSGAQSPENALTNAERDELLQRNHPTKRIPTSVG